MKRIYFDNINKNYFFLSISALSILCVFVGAFELIPFENAETNKMLFGVGLCLQVVFFIRQYFYKNYVQWNKKGAALKVNSRVGKSINFNQIANLKLYQDLITVTKTNGKTVSINVIGIATPDIKRLYSLLNNKKS